MEFFLVLFFSQIFAMACAICIVILFPLWAWFILVPLAAVGLAFMQAFIIATHILGDD